MVHNVAMTVSLLSVTPIKGLALHHPDHIDITAGGVVGDRALFLVDADDELISCTELGSLMAHRADYDASTRTLSVHGPSGLLRSGPVDLGEPLLTDFYGLRGVRGHVVVGWDTLFTEIGGRPVRLVLAETGAYDVAGLTLLGASSTRELASRSNADPVDGRRFRMNVEIAGAEPHDEDSWEGLELALGEVIVRVGGPVKRCAATTRNPDTGEVDLQTLRMIGNSRGRQETAEWGNGFYFGVYAEVVRPGRLHRGDAVTIVP